MWFEVDFKKQVVMLLPTMLRKPRLVAFLNALVEPIAELHYTFKVNRDSNLYKLNHNGQVCYLRKALNDAFDIAQRRIQIVDGNKYNREYIYTYPEQKPKYLGTMYLRSSKDFDDTGVDFIVLVPKEVPFNEYDMRALIDFYKLASKRYKIEVI